MRTRLANPVTARVPDELSEIPLPPSAWWQCGELRPAPRVAIVGSRRPTAYGRRVASSLAARLATSGVTVVSGLAFGIDAAAHCGALDSGGKTIAVLPGGLAEADITPRTNLELAVRISQQGSLVSEHPPGTGVHPGSYIARNRLIAAFGDCLVVVEAALPSGSLTTAKAALELGKDIWAVPGPIDSSVSAGTNQLISDGAHPLIDLEIFCQSVADAAPVEIHPVLAALEQPRHRDELVAMLGSAPAEINTELARLELRGLVAQQSGQYRRL